MIGIARKGEAIIGKFDTIIDTEEFIKLQFPTTYLKLAEERLYLELNREDNSELFSYKILSFNESEDLFGRKVTIIFEFVPDKELVEELKVVSERLEIGL